MLCYLHMETTTVLIDLASAALSIWGLIKGTGYGGTIGTALTLVGSGIILIGVSQFFETAGLYFLNAEMSTLEMVHLAHHLVLFTGMLLVFLGFEKLMNKN